MAHLIWQEKCLKIITIIAHHTNQLTRGDPRPLRSQQFPQHCIQSRTHISMLMRTLSSSTIQWQRGNRQWSKRVTSWKTTSLTTRTVTRTGRRSRVRAWSMCLLLPLWSLDSQGLPPWGAVRGARVVLPSLIFIRSTHRSLKSIRAVSISLIVVLSRKQSQVLVRRSDYAEYKVIEYFNLI